MGNIARKEWGTSCGELPRLFLLNSNVLKVPEEHW